MILNLRGLLDEVNGPRDQDGEVHRILPWNVYLGENMSDDDPVHRHGIVADIHAALVMMRNFYNATMTDEVDELVAAGMDREEAEAIRDSATRAMNDPIALTMMTFGVGVEDAINDPMLAPSLIASVMRGFLVMAVCNLNYTLSSIPLTENMATYEVFEKLVEECREMHEMSCMETGCLGARGVSGGIGEVA